MLASELNLWKYVDTVQHNMENHKRALFHFCPKMAIECTGTLAMKYLYNGRKQPLFSGSEPTGEAMLRSTACCNHCKASPIRIAGRYNN
jgi:hypothetical protein